MPTPTTIPTPTPTQTPQADDRYGVILHTSNPAEQQYFLDTLGTKWFIDFTASPVAIPGHQKVLFLGGTGLPLAQIQTLTQQFPGAVWYILGEPNDGGARPQTDGRNDGTLPEGLDEITAVVDQLHILYSQIKQLDPTAKITSPSVLNWDFTCTGCGGYESGHSWTDKFYTQYVNRHGPPPIDIWAIDVYPIAWDNLPTVNANLAIEQIQNMRAFLNNIHAQANKPIWITELSMHWGYPAASFNTPGCGTLPSPSGAYQTTQVINYMGTIFNWLEANSAPLNIQRWFQFISYNDITTCNGGAYAGISLFTSPQTGAPLSATGEYFRNRVLNIIP
ncbi:MAG: hypothetical protein FJ039_11025 [Chloroflexi bacterium]|nr:hypothetical protein [Chloroflexota bacterium]